MSITDIFRKKQQCIEAIQISAEAQSILDAPMVKDYFIKAEAAVLDKWKHTPDDALEARERLYLFNKMLGSFRQHFEGYVINGKFAENQLGEILKQEEHAAKKH